MPTLREIQTAVLDGVLAGPLQPAVPLFRPASDAAAARLRIYRSQVAANFAEALRSSFPAVLRLVGDAYFRQAAAQYQGQHPSRSGDLTDAGELFPAFLAQQHATDDYGYLADVARFEWLVQESCLSADHPRLDLQALGRLPAEVYPGLRFKLHPALRLFESPYPALRIWEVNTADGAAAPAIALDRGGNRMALLRQAQQLQFLSLDPAEYRFLSTIAAGMSFGDAVERGLDADSSFDASAVLRRFVAAVAIVSFSIPEL